MNKYILSLNSSNMGINESLNGVHEEHYELFINESVGVNVGGGIEEAPNDGNTYGRKNKSWVVIDGAASGKGIESMTEYFQAGTSNVLAPTGTWIEGTTPSDYGPDKPYLWKKTYILYDDGTDTWIGPVLISTWGQKGDSGDMEDKVYATSGSSLPNDVTIFDNTAHQDDDYLPIFVFHYSDSTTESKTATRTIPSIGSDARGRFVAVRKKINGTWGVFSSPALDAIYTVALLSEDDIEDVKNAVQEAIETDLTNALHRIQSLESEFDNIDDDLGGITQTINEQTGRLEALEARTVYTDDDIQSIVDLRLDAQQSTIEGWAASKVDDMFTDAGLTIDGIAGVVEQFTDFRDEDGQITTVRSWLDSHKGEIGQAASKAYVDGSIGDVREEMTLEDEILGAAITQSVTKSKYLLADDGVTLIDPNGNDVYYKGVGTSKTRLYYNPSDHNYYEDSKFEGNPYTGAKTKAVYPDDLDVGYTQIQAFSYIKQAAGQIDIVVDDLSKDTCATIVAKAFDANYDGSVIQLAADSLSFKGASTFDDPAYFLDNVWMKACNIREGTIEDATISDCTIINDIVSEGYEDTGEGFFLNAHTGEITATAGYIGPYTIDDDGFSYDEDPIYCEYGKNGLEYGLNYASGLQAEWFNVQILTDADNNPTSPMVDISSQIDGRTGLYIWTPQSTAIDAHGAVLVNNQNVVTSPDGALKIDIVTTYPATLADNTIYIKVA